MAGRRQGQKRDRRRRIVAAASALFAARGYAAATMQEIAAAAELAVGTLYNYFPSKPDLLVAIVRSETEQLLEVGKGILERSSPEALPEAVAELFTAYVQPFAEHDRGLWRELVGAAFAEPAKVGERFFELDLRLIGQISAFLERLRERGKLAPDVHSGRLAVALYAIYFTWLNAYLVNESMTIDDLRREIRLGIGVVLGPVLAPPATTCPPAQSARARVGGAGPASPGRRSDP